ncbi:MAG: ATP-binding cassette domain-containing protein, partial [Candidatus Bathyarchaeia archaeon]
MQGKVPVSALKGINLKVEKGDFIAILGPSGSGKSTLLNMIG